MDSISPVWQSCLEHFLQGVSRSHSSATVVAYKGALRRFFSSLPTLPELVTRQDVCDFIYARSESPWTRSADGTVKTSTSNFRLACVKAFYNFASAYTINERGEPVVLFQRPNPALGIRPVKPSRVYKALSEDELRRFFAAIDPSTVRGLRDRAILLFYFWTCRRRAEVQRLLWRDLESTTILDERGRSRLGWVYRYFGKGHSQEQSSAELPQPAIDALMSYLEASGRLDTMQPDSPLFVAIAPACGGLQFDTNKPLSESQIVRLFKGYVEAAGLDATRYSLHSLRHTAARLRRQSGSDVLAIQAVLGHACLNTTFIYLQVLCPVGDPGAKLLESQFASL